MALVYNLKNEEYHVYQFPYFLAFLSALEYRKFEYHPDCI